MAIKPKEVKEEVQKFPEYFTKIAKAAFSFQQIGAIAKTFFDREKDLIEQYFEENQDGVDIKVSEGLPTEFGLITFKRRDASKVDKDALIELIKNGTITVESLVAMGTFSATSVKESLPESASKKVIVEAEPTMYLEFRANTDFKTECQEMFEPLFQLEEKLEKPVASAKPPVAEKKPSKKDAAEKAKQIASGLRGKKSDSAKDELSRILGK